MRLRENTRRKKSRYINIKLRKYANQGSYHTSGKINQAAPNYNIVFFSLQDKYLTVNKNKKHLTYCLESKLLLC